MIAPGCNSVQFLQVHSLYFADNFNTVRNAQLFVATMRLFSLCKHHSEMNATLAIIATHDLVLPPLVATTASQFCHAPEKFLLPQYQSFSHLLCYLSIFSIPLLCYLSSGVFLIYSAFSLYFLFCYSATSVAEFFSSTLLSQYIFYSATLLPQ